MSTVLVSNQRPHSFTEGATRLFPNVVVRNEDGYQFVTSANLLAILCSKLKQVIRDAVDETDEPVHIVMSGYSEQVLLCLDDFLHEGVVNVSGISEEDRQAFCSELKYEFEEVLGINVPQDFWEFDFEKALDPIYINPLDVIIKEEQPDYEDDHSNEDMLYEPSYEEQSATDVQTSNGSKEGQSAFDSKELAPFKPKNQRGQVIVSGDESYVVHKSGYKRRINFPCPVCSIVIRERQAWFAHLKKEHPEAADDHLKNLECQFCKRTFQSIGVLEKHQRSKFMCKREEVCDKCGKTFPSYSSIHVHMKTVHGENISSCKVCGKLFKNEMLARNHFKNMHKNVLQCEHCARQFPNSYVLKQHISSVHVANDDKPFVCKVCGKGFGRKNGYLEHCRTHSSEKPYKCRYCDYACAASTNLVKHEKLKHKELYTPRSKSKKLNSTV